MDPRDTDSVHEREGAPLTASASKAEQPGAPLVQAQAQAQVPPPVAVPSPIQVQALPLAQAHAPPTPPKHSPTSSVHPQILIPRHVRSVERIAEDFPSPSRDQGSTRNAVQPLLGGSVSGELRPPGRTRTIDTHFSGRPASRLDWIVPVEEKVIPKLSVGERLLPTLNRAHLERDKYAIKAKMTGYALNAAIGLQVLLGGLSTLVASYLARARGSNEPELSITRVKDLEHFIRECDAFQMDHGHVMTDEHDERLFRFRSQFEELLGNANGERKLAPPV
ncbi:hypothetical protein C0992_005395 [Termitomyces sp. T32_za158]|nr:hypothetical protein C0992_005395 [Termitomyces sp. T32_za158]